MYRDLIVVFGGSGFLGRRLIPLLLHKGWSVRLATRNIAAAKQNMVGLFPSGLAAQLTYVPVSFQDPNGIQQAIENAGVVINCIGNLFIDEAYGLESIHIQPTRMLARIISEKKSQPHYIHMSVAGANKQSPCRFLSVKAAAETSVHNAALRQAYIIRPSLMFGNDDLFFNRYADIAKARSLLLVPGYGNGNTQPVYVGDVALAICKLIADRDSSSMRKDIQLGGPRTVTMTDLFRLIGDYTSLRRVFVMGLPTKTANTIQKYAHMMQKRFIYPEHNALFTQDTTPNADSMQLVDFRIEPTPMHSIMPLYLRRI